jgi:hypothetical protein
VCLLGKEEVPSSNLGIGSSDFEVDSGLKIFVFFFRTVMMHPTPSGSLGRLVGSSLGKSLDYRSEAIKVST